MDGNEGKTLVLNTAIWTRGYHMLGVVTTSMPPLDRALLNDLNKFNGFPHARSLHNNTQDHSLSHPLVFHFLQNHSSKNLL